MLRVYVWLYLIFVFSPIALIILFSFHSTPALIFPFEGFSVRWYKSLFANPTFVSSLWNSLIVAFCCSVATTVLGTLAALALMKLRDPAKSAFEFLNFAPIGFPGLFLGIALVVLFGQINLTRSLITVTIAHVLFALPFFVEAMRSRVNYMDNSLEEAARDLGATAGQAFWRVKFPLLAPTIAGAAILTFALSFDEFIITAFVSGNDTTLPLFIWSSMRRTVDPSINSASVIALTMSISVLLVGGLIFYIQRRRALNGRLSEE